MAHYYRRSPFRYGSRITTHYSANHWALDLAPRNDDDGYIFAIECGVVTDMVTGQGPNDAPPNLIIVCGVDGALTVYAHIDPAPDIYYAIVGWPVDQGDCIGKVDLSGESTGRHVHLVRLPAGLGTVDDIQSRVEDKAVFFTISTSSWPQGELPW